ncbi:hypothetical protein QOM21_17745 [Streptomyces sp. Pv4-95]|uniref:hypothetical protein n=1 Tax=Streptomyces sp. Pv4-95 TaxID=3049543 RepID=UPI003892353E
MVPLQRAPKFRMIALAGTAVAAIAIPLAAATAGPADTLAPGARNETAEDAVRPSESGHSAKGAKTGRPGHEGAPAGPRARGEGGVVGSATHREARDGTLGDLGLPLLSDDRRISRCGPELTSPQRVQAQTCVLAEDGATWARTYYRNRTGDPLRAVLTLLRPDDSTLQVHCTVPVADRPGMCETPTGATVHKSGVPYGAVAEFADAAGERLLLRAGNNSA